jgi:tetratricopeptide (TPR) repeat protein
LNGQKQELIAEVSRIGELIDEDHKGSLFLEQNRLETERLVWNINQEMNPVHSRTIFDLSTLQSIAAIMPDDPEVLNLLMHQYFRENQIGDAIQVMERIATIKPDSIQVQINLSVLYKIDGNIDQSVKTALKVLSRQEISGWLKYQNTAVNHFIDLCELRKKSDLNQAVAICELLASQCEITGLGKGECYYEMARLNIAKSGLSGVPDALGNLIKSGQQNQGYLMKWYPQDENFKPYRARLDQELIKVFPKFSFETQPKP